MAKIQKRAVHAYERPVFSIINCVKSTYNELIQFAITTISAFGTCAIGAIGGITRPVFRFWSMNQFNNLIHCIFLFGNFRVRRADNFVVRIVASQTCMFVQQSGYISRYRFAFWFCLRSRFSSSGCCAFSSRCSFGSVSFCSRCRSSCGRFLRFRCISFFSLKNC